MISIAGNFRKRKTVGTVVQGPKINRRFLPSTLNRKVDDVPLKNTINNNQNTAVETRKLKIDLTGSDAAPYKEHTNVLTSIIAIHLFNRLKKATEFQSAYSIIAYSVVRVNTQLY